MYILAIETTGAFASVALARANDEAGGSAGAAEGFEILAYAQGHDRYSHLQNLTPQIQQVICDAGITVDDLSAIAVANGPGSFTGIRIGVSTTRAISQIKDIPCIPVSSLEALALRAPAIRETAEPSARKNILVCRFSMRAEVRFTVRVILTGKKSSLPDRIRLMNSWNL